MPVQIRLNYSAGDAADQNKVVASSFKDLNSGIAKTNASLSGLGVTYSAQAKAAEAYAASAHRAAAAGAPMAKGLGETAAAGEKAKQTFAGLDAVYGSVGGSATKAVVAARSMGETIDPITGAVVGLAGGTRQAAEATEHASSQFREFKHVGKDVAEMAQHATATNLELGGVIRSAVNPEMLAMGVVALGVGYAVEQWRKEQEKIEKTLSDSMKWVRDYSKSLIEAKTEVLSFTDAQHRLMEVGQEQKKIDLAAQMHDQRKAIEATNEKIASYRGELAGALREQAELRGVSYPDLERRIVLIREKISDLNVELRAHEERLAGIRMEVRRGFTPEEQLKAQEAAKRAADEGMRAARGEANFKIEELRRQREQFQEWVKEKRISEADGAAAIAGIAQQETKAKADALLEARRDYEKYNRDRIEAAKRAEEQAAQVYKDATDHARAAGKTRTEQELDENERRQLIIRKALETGRGDAVQNKQFLYNLEREHTDIIARQARERQKREAEARNASAMAQIKAYEDEERRREQILGRGHQFLKRTRMAELKEYRDTVRAEMKIAEQGSKYAMDLARIKRDLDREIQYEKINQAIAYASASVSLASQVFGHNKAIAYAETIVNTARAIMAAAPNYVLMAINAAIGAVQLAKISSTNAPTAKMHGGLDRAPDDVTTIIHKEEMVVPPDPARKARELVDLARRGAGGEGGGKMVVNVTVKGSVYERRRALRGLGRDMRKEMGRAGMRTD